MAPVATVPPGAGVLSLLPKGQSWRIAETATFYGTDRLFEYIDGAAEAYIGYGFRGLATASFAAADREATLTAEIYDMGTPESAFGIYSAERRANGRFLPIGVQAYIEGPFLAFFSGRYYVKLLCFNCGQTTERDLRLFCSEIDGGIHEKGSFPRPLGYFPSQALVPNSEKLVVRDFLGYDYLRHGYLADYEVGAVSFRCFLVVASGAEEAEMMLTRYLADQARMGAKTTALSSGGHRLEGRLGSLAYVTRVENVFCGAVDVAASAEAIGEKYLTLLAEGVRRGAR